MRCLFCHEPFIEKPSWQRLFMLEAPSVICERCEEKLEPLSGVRCVRCSRPLTATNSEKCVDCIRWDERLKGDVLERNVSLYRYNAALKEWLATFKYRGDAEIATFFAEKLFAQYIRHFRSYFPVEIPLSRERLSARGFNQSVLLMKGWAEETNVLLRRDGKKQSKRTRSERLAQFSENPFHINEEKAATIRGKNIVLIDDIYTTGTTVRQAALVLKRHGATHVASLTIAR